MKIFVVSLLHATDRRTHIKSEMAKHQLSFEWLDAIEGCAESDELSFSPHLSQPQINCFLSHVACWERIVSDNLSWAAIHEDDIHLGEAASDYYANDAWIPKDSMLVKTEISQDRCKLFAKPVSTIGSNRHLHRLAGNHCGTAGYVLSNTGAKYLLSLASHSTIDVPVDDFMFARTDVRLSLNTMQMNPGICVQDRVLDPISQRFPSSIEPSKKRNSKDTYFLGKAIREVARIPRNMKKLINSCSGRLVGIKQYKLSFR